MFTGDFMRVTVFGTLPGASNPIINTWDYQCIVASDANALQNVGSYIAASFMARYYAPLVLTMHQEYRINRVELREYGDPEGGFDLNGNLFQGGSSGLPLPPFVTYSVKLIRANYDFKSGRKAFAGCNSAALTGLGGLNATTINTFQTVFSGWLDTEWTVEAGEADFTFQEVLVRSADGINTVPSAFSTIQGYSLEKFGSQNTRKP